MVAGVQEVLTYLVWRLGSLALHLCLSQLLLETLAVHRDATVTVELLPLWRGRLIGCGCCAVVSRLFVLLAADPPVGEEPKVGQEVSVSRTQQYRSKETPLAESLVYNEDRMVRCAT